MIRIFLVAAVLFSCLIFFPFQSFSQMQSESPDTEVSLTYASEEEFQQAVLNYVKELLTRYYVESLPQERYLVSLMRLVNDEMDERVTNRREAVENYFNDLRKQLNELKQLKNRLANAGISELDSFIGELENRMKLTIRSNELDFRKKKVFEDALQLLYIAEEMIKMDQLRDPGSLDVKISRSKDQLLNAFGEVGRLDNVPLDVKPTIFNLFDEWRKTDSYQFSARLMDVKVARSQLLKSGNIEDINRMFNSQLEYAYSSFNYAQYDLTDRLLEDLVDTYEKAGVKDFEDVYFYWAESNFALNRFLEAREIYKMLLENYPATSFLPRTYARLIQIEYKFENFDEVAGYYQIYQNLVSPQQEEYYDIQFVAALSFYEAADYNRAVEILLSFPRGNDYYYFSQYLVGTIYAAGQNYDLAYDVFEAMATSKNTPPGFYSRSLLKLAQISYERGDYQSSLTYAARIPFSYERYDRVLDIMLWAEFMKQQTIFNEPGQRDFTDAKYYAYRLLEEFYSSEYRLEAEGLLGYIYQQENDLSLAKDFFTDVYKSKVERNALMRYLMERDSLATLYYQAKAEEEKALRADDRHAYVLAAARADGIIRQIWRQRIEESSNIGEEVSVTVNDLINQLSELNQLKSLATEQGNEFALLKIDSMMTRIRTSLQDYSTNDIRQALFINSYPVAQKVAEGEFKNIKNDDLRRSILEELNLLNQQITETSVEIQRYKLLGDNQKVVSLEQELRHLLELRKKYDRLYVSAMELTPGETYAEFDRWGDFGAVGIIDVNFGQKDNLQEEMSKVSTVYNSIVDKIAHRREAVEAQLRKIEAEIRFMTMKARLEERQRLRAEREQSFRETYFDKRTSEFEEK
ncbi:MAG: hypothetical protein EH225_09020 [Calditrichaeota bacterium]|nr:hypothetical protein [Calditrichota bacterium]RQV92865.1 MAG: hypothetical protein EH221_10725 [bacterium]RQW02014.1 MAG: hypothetical protein EH225_09020 [Calditrichota bacterium]